MSVAAPARRAGAPAPARRAGALGAGRSSTLWLSLIVLLPLAAVVARSLDGGLDAFWDAVTAARRSRALRFTLLVSLVAAAINAVFGHARSRGCSCATSSAASASSTR